MTSFVDDSIEFFFDALSEGTAAQGAKLVFRRVPVTLRCRQCGAEYVPLEVAGGGNGAARRAARTPATYCRAGVLRRSDRSGLSLQAPPGKHPGGIRFFLVTKLRSEGWV